MKSAKAGLALLDGTSKGSGKSSKKLKKAKEAEAKSKEAMLMHVMVTLDTIKKHGHFRTYDEAQALYLEQKEAVKLVKASLSLLEGKSRKTLKKAKEAEGVTKAPDNPMQVSFQADLEMSKLATENAKGTMTAAASQMFTFYANSLSVKAKCAWDKIVEE